MAADDPGTVRSAVLTAIPVLLRERGVDLQEMLASLGLPPNQFDDPDNRMSYRIGGMLLQRCADVTGCDHFGLLVGRHPSAMALGLLGELVQRSRNVQTAIHSLIAHLHLQTRGGVPTHTVRGSDATFGYAIYLRDMQATAHACDLALAFEFNILRTVCGPRWGPSEVLFARAAPRDTKPYEDLYGCRLVFDSDRTEMVFNRHWLDQPPMGADPERHRQLLGQILAEETSHPHALVARVREALRKMVSNGRATESLLSDLLAIPTRSLRRVLDQQGTSFRELLEDVRYEVARQLLLETEMPTAEIALSLDYADASAFTRAFRRWTGVPPAAWRLQARARRSAI